MVEGEEQDDLSGTHRELNQETFQHGGEWSVFLTDVVYSDV